MMPRFVYVAAAIITTVRALRQTNAARLTLFGDGCGFRAARLDERMRGHPAVAAAARRGRLDPTLRFLREVLGVVDATDLLETTPQLASMPLAVLAARHAYLRRVGAPHGAQLATPGLPAAPRRPLRHARGPRRLRRGRGGDETTWRRSWPPSGAAAGARRRTADALWSGPGPGWAPARDGDRRGASAAHVAAGRGAVAVLGAARGDGAGARPRRGGRDAAPLGGLRRARERRGHGLRGRRGRPRFWRGRARDDGR